MNEQTDLLQDLRTLAADGPRQAPPHIEARLQAEFRRQNRRRKFISWMPALAIPAAAAIALFVWMHAAPAQPVANAIEEDAEASSFYPLPQAESLPEVDNAMVVRVQLPVSSLQLMGVPISEDRGDTSVQADVLLGQDGLARGVRLVQ
jgi:hypothetical protein